MIVAHPHYSCFSVGLRDFIKPFALNEFDASVHQFITEGESPQAKAFESLIEDSVLCKACELSLFSCGDLVRGNSARTGMEVLDVLSKNVGIVGEHGVREFVERFIGHVLQAVLAQEIVREIPLGHHVGSLHDVLHVQAVLEVVLRALVLEVENTIRRIVERERRARWGDEHCADTALLARHAHHRFDVIVVSMT